MKPMLLTLTILLAVADAAAATDGVIEINQARALAGGITPGDTPGFPITIDQRGSYRLTGDLTAIGVIAIRVAADDVTLDLNGFAVLVGSGVNAIESYATANVNVMNGSVIGGIYLGGTAARVERIRMRVGTMHVEDGLVTACTLRLSSGNGIEMSRGLVTGNVVTDVSGHGLWLGGLVGYSGNVLNNWGGNGNVVGGRSLGQNLCGLAVCP